MINKKEFLTMSERHGFFGSWAIWSECGDTPKSNMSVEGLFDELTDDTVLKELRPDWVLLGLNGSRELKSTQRFTNFHDVSRYSHDYKIRFALKGTPAYGAWMTDIIKSHVDPDSLKVKKLIEDGSLHLEDHFQVFNSELKDLGCSEFNVVCFGEQVFKIMDRHKNLLDFRVKLIKVRHYSSRISKENYRIHILEKLKNIK